MNKKQKCLHEWLANLMKNMDTHLEEETKIKLMEECGRSCAQNSIKEEALKYQGKLDDWLGKMKKWVGVKNIHQQQDRIQVVYDKCFCQLVQDIPPILSASFCHCSRGWLMEIFETVLEKPVTVEMEDSIMKGGKQCRFSVSF
ncbi:MAG: hypothetical protein PVH61_29410 [Candidatus Aminicenantes bacterium]|jgi:predicted hydrocarbon binding protein